MVNSNDASQRFLKLDTHEKGKAIVIDRGHFVPSALLQHVALEQLGFVPLVNVVGELDDCQTFLVDRVLL